jgi:putative DNA primase/helicase
MDPIIRSNEWDLWQRANPLPILTQKAIWMHLAKVSDMPSFHGAAVAVANMVRNGEIDKQSAVDRLDQVAIAQGLNDLQDDLQAVLAAAFSYKPLGKKYDGTNSDGVVVGGRRLEVRVASRIAPEPVTWIWPGRLALGKLTVIAGDPGLGKSQVLISAASTISTGGQWPCGEGASPQGSVIILSAEDGDADTTVPRLMAAGAILNRVHIVSSVCDLSGAGRRTFNLEADLNLLDRTIDALRDVLAVIIDPVSAYMGKVDTHNNSEVRGVLERVAELATRKHVAVLVSTHITKSNVGRALHRFIGSIAFVAAARTAFLVAEDPDDPGRRLFLHAKNNLAPRQPGLAFRLGQSFVVDDILASSVAWESGHVGHTADEVLGARRGEGETAKDDAVEFLRTILAGGPVSVAELEREARAACLLGEQSIGQSKPFRSARKVLAVVSRKLGMAEGWVWELPKMPATAEDAHEI